MKFETQALKIVFDHHTKYHEDLSFRFGDICKTILAFSILSFNEVCISSQFKHQSFPNFTNVF